MEMVGDVVGVGVNVTSSESVGDGDFDIDAGSLDSETDMDDEGVMRGVRVRDAERSAVSDRVFVPLGDGVSVLVAASGVSEDDAVSLCDACCVSVKVPVGEGVEMMLGVDEGGSEVETDTSADTDGLAESDRETLDESLVETSSVCDIVTESDAKLEAVCVLLGDGVEEYDGDSDSVIGKELDSDSSRDGVSVPWLLGDKVSECSLVAECVGVGVLETVAAALRVGVRDTSCDVEIESVFVAEGDRVLLGVAEALGGSGDADGVGVGDIETVWLRAAECVARLVE